MTLYCAGCKGPILLGDTYIYDTIHTTTYGDRVYHKQCYPGRYEQNLTKDEPSTWKQETTVWGEPTKDIPFLRRAWMKLHGELPMFEPNPNVIQSKTFSSSEQARKFIEEMQRKKYIYTEKKYPREHIVTYPYPFTTYEEFFKGAEMNPKPTKYPFKFRKYDVVFYNDKTYVVEFTEYDWNVQGEVVTLKDAETGTIISGVDSRQVKRMG